MLKSLYSGVSGMKGFQTKMDVIGNNIANVNTVGFKKSRVVFQDIISQNIKGATPPSDTRGGVNPMQIGLGSKISAIDNVHTPGSPMSTNIGSDLAIDGDAFFVLTPDAPNLPGAGYSLENMPTYLTKAGNFGLDADGYLVNSNGFFVTGVRENPGNTLDPYDRVKIKINEDATDPANPKKIISYSIDTNGYINVVNEDGKSGQLAFNGTDYFLSTPTTPKDQLISLGTAVVPNPAGLKKVGNTMFEVTQNAMTDSASTSDTEPIISRIADNKGGQMNSGMLEMSNVDLTEEFTEMIIAQRGFQANSRTITTSDSILEEIVNLKR
ncbi:flagellar hook-basal body complex protein [Neobacillus sp. MM2021_6]|uniref:flagellar hook-basal body complex protein n=1 Tax=Bacillaceae TaxID=186817 RepID=UPI00140A322F|nr:MULTISPECIES: flagellar hook-basal body complex protein [Bacillaceae]MBO0961805.1 flagellar hook-basal body complex protein [Neobacillus sp. MM2021_6]NHC21090.1 flagellar hook-basal body complex protein [Bacillus sp. MM2020_4]